MSKGWNEKSHFEDWRLERDRKSRHMMKTKKSEKWHRHKVNVHVWSCHEMWRERDIYEWPYRLHC